IVHSYPVEVKGEACHGLHITRIDINGRLVDLNNPAEATTIDTPPSGPEAAGTHKILFDVFLPQTNLFQDVQGQASTLGTFDAGSNRVLAAATDERGNRTYDSVIFATGTTLNPGIAPQAVQALQASAKDAFQQHIVQQ